MLVPGQTSRGLLCLRINFILVLACLSLLCHGCLPSTTRIEGGQLTGEQYWQGRIDIVGDVELATGSRLVLAPGAELVFHPAPPELDRWQDHPHFPGSELIVYGEMFAEGTPAAPIRFRPLDPDGPAGSWGGVNVVASPQVRVSHAIFQGADSALHIQESTAFIEDSRFIGNLVAIRFHSSEILIEHNLIEDNDTGIRFHFGAPVICNNLIRKNRRGMFVTAHPQDYRIENNQFDGNIDYDVVLGEEVPEDLDLDMNWWGGRTPSSIMDKIYDQHREAHLGRVRIDPLRDNPVQGVGPR